MKRRLLVVAILLLPLAVRSQTIVPQLVGFDAASITLTWAAVPGATAYNVYRLPFLTKRRDVKPRLYDKVYVLGDPSPTITYTDYYPFDLTLRPEDRMEYLVTAIGPDGVAESPFSSAFSSRLGLSKARADFAFSADAYCPSTPVHFSDGSSGLVAAYQWALGDEVFGAEAQAERSFEESGDYQVRFEVLGPIGTAMAIKTVTIFPSPQPQILGEHAACESTQLTAQGDQTDYQWYFGGLAVPDAHSRTLLVQDPGVYEVAYKDEHSCRGQSEGFTFDHYPEPICAFTPAPSESPAGELIGFSQESAGERLAYSWDFGDGTRSTEAQPVHAFRRPGQYTVTLSIGDLCARTGSAQAAVTIGPGAFTFSGDVGTCMGGTVLKLMGDGFPENPVVYLDGRPCEILSSSPQEIQIVTPPHPGGLDYYDVEVKDSADMAAFAMRQAFRYVTLAFAALPDANAVTTVDMNQRAPFAWSGGSQSNPSHLPIQIARPGALAAEGHHLWIGGTGGLCKFSTGTGMVEAAYPLAAEAQVTALAVAGGLHGRYLFAGVFDPAADPKGSVLILDADTLTLLATSPFDGDIDGQALDIKANGGKVYLLARGPLSESDNKQHKKAMAVTVYDPYQEFQNRDGSLILPPETSKNKGAPTIGDVAVAGLAFDAAGGRLFYPDAPNLSIYELSVNPFAFKGPDIGTAGGASALLSLPGTGDPMLLAIKPSAGTMDVFALPANGPKPLIATMALNEAGCASPHAMAPWGDDVVISCTGTQRLIFLTPATLATNGEALLGPGESPTALAVQEWMEVGQ